MLGPDAWLHLGETGDVSVASEASERTLVGVSEHDVSWATTLW